MAADMSKNDRASRAPISVPPAAGVEELMEQHQMLSNIIQDYYDSLLPIVGNIERLLHRYEARPAAKECSFPPAETGIPLFKRQETSVFSDSISLPQ